MNFAMEIANHCSPALAGIKPANLISYSSATCCSIAEYLVYLAEQLQTARIFFRLLQSDRHHRLCLVYKERILQKHLSRPEVKHELALLGYPTDADLEAMLDHLAKRFKVAGSFPHEIAYFLGYPVDDIKGFVVNDGRNYCLNGYWKVYSDPEQAMKSFRRYTLCREAVMRRLAGGTALENLFR